MSKKINVRDYVNSCDLNSPEQGDEFYAKMLPEVKKSIRSNERVEIDFEGVNTITTAFLNNSIAKLFIEVGTEKLKDKIVFSGLKYAYQIESLRLSINAALALSEIEKQISK